MVKWADANAVAEQINIWAMSRWADADVDADADSEADAVADAVAVADADAVADAQEFWRNSR